MRRLLLVFALWTAITSLGVAQEIDPWGMPKPWKRLEWFYGRRAFPYNDVPAGAWLRAYEQAQQLPVHQGEGLQGQALRWEFFGPDSTNRNWLARVNAIAIHPTDPNTIYIGVSKGGVWKSTNRGSTWTNLTDFLAAQYVGCLTIDPHDPNTIYLGTGEKYYAAYSLVGVGIYRSTDGGNSWTLIGNNVLSGQRINEIVIDPNNRNKWVISTDAGISITTIGGSTWTQLNGAPAGNGQSWYDLVMRVDPINPNIAYVGEVDLFRTTDGGSSWTRINPQATVGHVDQHALEFDPTDPAKIFIGSDGGLFYSANRGTTLTPLNSGRGTMESSTPSMYTPRTQTDWWQVLRITALRCAPLPTTMPSRWAEMASGRHTNGTTPTPCWAKYIML